MNICNYQKKCSKYSLTGECPEMGKCIYYWSFRRSELKKQLSSIERSTGTISTITHLEFLIDRCEDNILKNIKRNRGVEDG